LKELSDLPSETRTYKTVGKTYINNWGRKEKEEGSRGEEREKKFGKDE
jgi:hypothetical protein